MFGEERNDVTIGEGEANGIGVDDRVGEGDGVSSSGQFPFTVVITVIVTNRQYTIIGYS